MRIPNEPISGMECIKGFEHCSPDIWEWVQDKFQDLLVVCQL